MNKKIFFFLFLFLICPKSGWADSSSQVQELCENNPNQLNLINLDQLKIKNSCRNNLFWGDRLAVGQMAARQIHRKENEIHSNLIKRFVNSVVN